MDALADRLRHHEQRLLALVEAYRKLEAEAQALRAEKSELQRVVAEQKAQLDYFQNHDEVSKIVAAIASDERPVAALRAQIDACVREIDRCLAHLSK